MSDAPAGGPHGGAGHAHGPDERRTDVPGQSGDAVQPGGPGGGENSGQGMPGTAGAPGSSREGLIDPRELGHTASPGTGMPSRGQQEPARSAGRRNPDGGRDPRGGRGRDGRRRRRRGDPNAVVPEAEFTSYYGRPVVKPSPWTFDIPTYLFLGGVAGSSALLGEGGARTGRPAVRRSGRIGALVALGSSAYFLIHDLGRPDRFYNMLRIVKPTSPMSVGTWILTAFGVPAGVAAVSEVARLLPPAVTSRVPGALLSLLHRSAGPAGLAAAAIGPLVSTYTAVLLTDTASPAWFGARRELPFMFAGSALSAGAGLALVTAPLAESGPARALAIAGAAVELGAELPMRASMGIASETLDAGLAGRWHRTSRALTIGGIALAALSRRSRALSAAAGVALLGGSLATRFSVFEAGQASARDPRYTVVPQRARSDARSADTRSADTAPAV